MRGISVVLQLKKPNIKTQIDVFFSIKLNRWLSTPMANNTTRASVIMHQSISAAPRGPPPPPPAGLLRGICKFCAARGPGICQPRAFDTHAVSYQNITTQRILLKKKQADWLICQGREKIEEVCRGMFSIVCMHFFNYRAKLGSYRRESTFFFGY